MVVHKLLNPRILQEIGYISFSYLSSVSIIFINKHIYGDDKVAGTLLMGLHFFSNFMIAIILNLLHQTFPNYTFLTLFKAKKLPLKICLSITLNVALAIFVGNLSLIHNSITVYQLAKLIVIPCILVINFLLFKKWIETNILLSLITILVGMTIVLYNDFNLSFIGGITIISAIILGATSQIAINYYSKEYELNGFELLLNHSLFSAILLLVLAIFVDGPENIQHSIVRYFTNPTFNFAVTVSCFTSFIVNIAAYLVIGKLSPLTFQVLGHAKTISILVGGYLLFGKENEMNGLKAFGSVVALVGTFLYSYFKYQEEVVCSEKELSNAKPQNEVEQKPILDNEEEEESPVSIGDEEYDLESKQ
ncbi:hypothetical protein ABK040_007010 [Willaertia magna]